MNILTIVADSCRYDTYTLANTPNIDKYFSVEEAYSQATFTLPAHSAILQGFYPSTMSGRPLYNRFIKSIFQWHYQKPRDAMITIPKDSTTIPGSLRSKGYNTFCVGGVGWFKKPTILSTGFINFEHIPNTEDATNKSISFMRGDFYGLINYSVTHRPYNCPLTPHSLHGYQGKKSGVNYHSDYDEVLHKKQIACLEYLDKYIGIVMGHLSDNVGHTVVGFCGDHGECFGEDGCYGHGFYHKNVMSVPLGWSVIKDGNIDKCI